jgi:hypothetical protein
MTESTQADQLTELRDRLQSQKTKLAQRLLEVDEKLKAVTLTLSLLNRTEERETESDIVSPRELQGMTQLEAMVHIARANKNRIKIIDAKKLLTKAGVMKLTKNSYGVLYTVINRSGKFEHCGPGEYELIPDNPPAAARLLRTA